MTREETQQKQREWEHLQRKKNNNNNNNNNNNIIINGKVRRERESAQTS